MEKFDPKIQADELLVDIALGIRCFSAEEEAIVYSALVKFYDSPGYRAAFNHPQKNVPNEKAT